jgi:hypothetical protein
MPDRRQPDGCTWARGEHYVHTEKLRSTNAGATAAWPVRATIVPSPETAG